MSVITVKIDVTKIDKSKIFVGKNGAKWVDLVLIPTKESKYGEDYLVKQSASKEEREAKAQLPILGNAKISKGKQEKPESTEVGEDGGSPW